MNRREIMILGGAAAIAAVNPIFPVFSAKEPSIAERFCRCLVSLGVLPVFNEEDAEFAKSGAKITTATRLGLLSQRHVDWFDPFIEGVPQKSPISDRGLFALANNVARSIYPAKQLKTFSLFVPSDRYEGGLVSYGPLKLRILRTYQPYQATSDEMDEAGECMLNRIDILFPETGV
jgi:hypothetical protein